MRPPTEHERTCPMINADGVFEDRKMRATAIAPYTFSMKQNRTTQPPTFPRHREEMGKELLRRILELPDAEKLHLYGELSRFLSAEPGRTAKIEKEIIARRDALAALEAAANHLGISEARELGVDECNRAWRELKSSWRSGRVIAAWGSWNNAKVAFGGSRVPMSVTQRLMMKEAFKNRRKPLEAILEGPRRFLDSCPEAETGAAYEAFREVFNDRLDPGEAPIMSRGSLTTRLGLPFKTILQVARGNLTLERAWSDRQGRLSAGVEWSPLVDRAEAARVLRVAPRTMEYHTAGEAFPPAAARLSGRRLWRRVDVERYASAQDGPYVTKRMYELQPELLNRADLSARLALGAQVLVRLIRARRWDRVPEPEGRAAGGIFYWRTSAVERWESQGHCLPAENAY
jgi:hypothetical protein